MKNSLGKRARRPKKDGLVMDEASKENICLDIDIQPEHLQPQHVPRVTSETKQMEAKKLIKYLTLFMLCSLLLSRRRFEIHIIDSSTSWESYQTRGRRRMMYFSYHICHPNIEGNDQAKDLK